MAQHIPSGGEGSLPMVLRMSKLTCPGSHDRGKGWNWDANLGPLTPLPALSKLPVALLIWRPHCQDTEAAPGGLSEPWDAGSTGLPSLS